MQKSRNRSLSNGILLAAYGILTIVLLIFHEPWRDEAQQWLFVKNQSFLSMLSSLHYEGHPALWYLLIWPLTRLGFGYFSVFILHTILVLFCGWLIVCRSPFQWYLKALFLFSYTLGYEYNAVARSYILACVLLFLIAPVFPFRHGRYRIVYGVLLILLINTHLFAALAAITLMIYDFIFVLSKRIPGKKSNHKLLKSYLVLFAFFAAGILLLVFTLTGKREFYAGSPVTIGSLLKSHFLFNACSIYYQGMCSQLWSRLAFLLPSMTFTSASGIAVLTLHVIIGISLIAVLLYRFKITFLVGVFCLLLSAVNVIGAPFTYIHAGLVFAFFIFTLWIQKTTKDEFSTIDENWTNKISGLRTKKVNVIAAAALVSFAAGTGVTALSVYEEIRYPFSQSKAAAEFIRNNGYDTSDTRIVSPSIAKTTGILAYLENIRGLSLPNRPDTVSYSTWDKAYMAYNPDDNTIFEQARHEYCANGKLPLVVFCKGAQNAPDDFVCIFDNSNTRTFHDDEKYCIYTLKQLR